MKKTLEIDLVILFIFLIITPPGERQAPLEHPSAHGDVTDT